MFGFVFVEHLFIHDDLLGQGRLDSFLLFAKLVESVLENADRGFRFSYFRRFFLYFFECAGLSIEDIIDKFARSEGQSSVGGLSVLLRRQSIEFGG